MIPSSLLFCNACGAANQPQAKLCWACSHPLDTSVEDSSATSATDTVPAEPPAPAALLAGRYRVIGMVGKGGYGAVYKAEDRQRQSALVAIKSINLHGLSSQEVIEATDTFNREMLLLSQLQHANLPRIYDHFTDHEHWYLVMDFIAGETLEAYVNRAKAGHLAAREVLEIGIQLCEVLHYLHSQQPPIIFRDVKPANVMRTATGHLYLIDFGIARRFRPGQKHDTTVLGSPGYAPPEQYGRAQTTVQSDIYSLGATLRYLLTGKDPLEAFPSSASSYIPYIQDAPVELEVLLVQMLELDASKRPASMEMVKRDLQHIPGMPPAQGLGSAIQPMSAPTGAGGQVLTYTGHSRRVLALAWSPDGTRIASASEYETVQVWDASTGRQALTYTGHSRRVLALAWSPDGTRIASVSDDETVQVWDASTGGQVLTYTDHSFSVNAVAWSPDGRHIASGSADQTVQVWDATTGRNVFTYTGHSFSVNAVAWSPDGKRIASGSRDKTVQVWDARRLWRHGLTYTGHTDAVNAVAWSPDGKRIASGSDDHTVQVWDAIDGGHVYTYHGHTDAVNAVAWSPDGKRIASASGDGTVQVWDAANGGDVYTYRGHSHEVDVVVWSPDSKRIASGSQDYTVQVWRAP